MPVSPCRDCGRDVSLDASQCPECGAPRPSEAEFTGWGYEYKSDAVLLGLPLIHDSFKYRPNRMPVVARGWLAIGQFSYGFVNISQFGIGPFCLCQFALAAVAISQFCAAVLAVCQIGFVYDGWGMVLAKVADLL